MSAPRASVLYDVPGPKARMWHRGIGAAVVLALLGLLIWAGQILADKGQFSGELWGPFLDPNNDVFSDVWALLREGIGRTLYAAAVAIVLSTVLGTILGVSRMLLGQKARLPLVGFLEVVRGIPVVIAIYLASRLLPEAGISLDFMPGGSEAWFLIIGLTLYNSVVIAEILRAGVAALPKGQAEAASALGLTRVQTMMLVLLPQARRIMLPALISQLVVILKDTSLAAVLGMYDELLKVGKTIALNLDNPLQTYVIVGVMFVAVNMLLSAIAVRWQRAAENRVGAT